MTFDELCGELPPDLADFLREQLDVITVSTAPTQDEIKELVKGLSDLVRQQALLRDDETRRQVDAVLEKLEGVIGSIF